MCLLPPSLTRHIEGHEYTFLGWSSYSDEFRFSIKMLGNLKHSSSGPLGRSVYIYEKLDTVRELMKKRYKSPEICATYVPTEIFQDLYKVVFPRNFQKYDKLYKVTDKYKIPSYMFLYLDYLKQTKLIDEQISKSSDKIMAFTSLNDIQDVDAWREPLNNLQMGFPVAYMHFLKFQCMSLADSYGLQDFPTWKEQSEDPKVSPFLNRWVFYNRNPKTQFYLETSGELTT
ncbi:hypothetical protein BKA69DRAFT_1088412 [Paraphysoderma sedebokerense]|nr:hypothetical protein BKA69DRAFT_1088412 [Paraphysoderma sedebokerense]